MKGRFFAGFGAALFLVTSSALAVAVIISLAQSHSANNTPPQTSPNSQPVTANKVNSPATEADVSSTANVDGKPMAGFQSLSKPLSTLEYADIKTGNGQLVKQNSTITATYVGALANNGIVFDSTESEGGKPFTASIASGVIRGWTDGIPGMRVGGTRELFIPASLGYGTQKAGPIPANSDLVFYVTVLASK